MPHDLIPHLPYDELRRRYILDVGSDPDWEALMAGIAANAADPALAPEPEDGGLLCNGCGNRSHYGDYAGASQSGSWFCSDCIDGE